MKRSKSNIRDYCGDNCGVLRELLEVLQVHPDEVEQGRQLHVLWFVGQPLDGVVDALLDLRGALRFTALRPRLAAGLPFSCNH